MRALARWGALPLFAAPLGAWALGLGDIELRSALNQPLEADIRLVSATPEELEGLRVTLAPAETFDRYGLERPAFLSSLSFRLARDEQGRDVVRVTSRQSVTEPFLTLLVEATWPRGRLLREYTLLLDPPVLLPPAAEPVTPARTQPPSQTPAGPIDRAPAAPAGSASAAPAPAPPAAAPSVPGAAPRPAAAGTYGPVQRAETLWTIASRLRPDGVSLMQMMVALYEANPQAFDGNMNLLLQGAVLRVPEVADVRRIGAQAATAEFQRQTTEWEMRTQEPRLRLVAAGEDVGAPVDRQAATPGGDPAEVARLEQELRTLRAELEDNRRLLQVRDAQLAELQAQLAAAERASEETRLAAAPAPAAGVDLESEPLFADELPGGAVADAPVDGDIVAEFESEVAAAPLAEAEAEAVALTVELGAAAPEPETTARETPAAAPATSPAVVSLPEPTPSLLSQALAWLTAPLLWIGLGAAALLGAALYFIRQRRDEGDDEATGEWTALADVDDEIDVNSRESTERLRQAHEESIVVEESRAEARVHDEHGDTLSSETALDLDQDDPLAEADFHIAYGLYDQAADLVSKALEAEPERRDLRLKLLEVYFVWGNKEGFLAAARQLHETMGETPAADWDKVLIMGKQLCPGEALFAGAAGGAGGAIDLDLAGESSGALDLELGEDAFGEALADDNELDLAFGDTAFDDTGTLRTDEPAPSGRGGGASTEDFGFEATSSGKPTGSDAEALDIGAQTAAGIEEALFLDDDEETGTREEVADALAVTQESPTVETPRAAGGHGDEMTLGAFERTDAALVEDVDEESGAWEQGLTMEAPTLQSPRADEPTRRSATDWPTKEVGADDWALGDHGESESPTMETPTVETRAGESPTMEMPTIETRAGESPTLETPTLETPQPAGAEDEEIGFGATEKLLPVEVGLEMESEAEESTGPALRAEGTGEMSTVEQPRLHVTDGATSLTGEHTLEIDLDDLGLDPSDLETLAEDFDDEDTGSTREQPGPMGDPEGRDILSATGITKVLEDDELDGTATSGDDAGEDARSMRSEEDEQRPLAGRFAEGYTLTGTEVLNELPDAAGSRATARPGDGELDFDLALGGGDTVEQPRAAALDGSGLFSTGNGRADVDFDLGFNLDEDSEDALDAYTMSEVGTKLDLARAYIDMGDPEGARSILEEVLDEGDSNQRQEAKSLIDAMSA